MRVIGGRRSLQLNPVRACISLYAAPSVFRRIPREFDHIAELCRKTFWLRTRELVAYEGVGNVLEAHGKRIRRKASRFNAQATISWSRKGQLLFVEPMHACDKPLRLSVVKWAGIGPTWAVKNGTRTRRVAAQGISIVHSHDLKAADGIVLFRIDRA